MKKGVLILLLVTVFSCGCAEADGYESGLQTEYVTDAQTDEESSEDSVYEAPEDSETDSETPDAPPENNETGTDTKPQPPENENPKSEDEFVRTPTDVSAEMYDPSFWIKDGYDKIVMTPEQIEYYNDHSAAQLGAGTVGVYDLDGIPSTISGAFVRHYVKLNIPKYYNNYYIDGEKRTNLKYWEDMVELADLDSIENEVSVRFGYSVTRSTLRYYPTDDFLSPEYGNTLDDDAATSDFMPFLPLCILHESADGKWYYCLMYGMGGWIRKENVALCETRRQWISLMETDDFLVVTGKELRLPYDILTPEFSGMLLPMGTRLELVKAEDAPKYVNNRLTYGNYIVKIPIRGKGGMLDYKYTLIPVSSDVSVGFMDYTRENVLKLAFKLLGDRYGWSGTFFSNDCSGIVREIFLCFGLELPRTASAQQRATGLERIIVEEMTSKQKEELLSKTEGGVLVFFPGHIMIYLGEYNGEYYVISATGGFNEEPGEKYDVEDVSNICINTLDVIRSDGSSWLENVWCVQFLREKAD